MTVGDSFNLKKVLWIGYGVFVFLVIIALTGFAANLALYLFCAAILGWGDSAPEWYIALHNWVFYAIFVASAGFWILGGYWRYAIIRKKAETEKA